MTSGQLQLTSAKPPGRNEACSCGSGKKFKRCCLREAAVAGQPTLRAAGGSKAVPASAVEIAAGVACKQRGRVREAIAHFRRAAALEPTEYAAHFELGSALAQTGSYEDAARSLTHAIQLRPDAAEAISNLGAVFRAVGNHGRAVTCLQRALAVQPGYAPALSNLGSSLLALGRQSEAVAALAEAVRNDPALADAHINLSGALVAAGRYAEAIEHCERALALKPEDADALLNLGNAYKERGQLSLAETTYARAIAASPGDARPLLNLGDTLRDHGRVAEAGDAYRQALGVGGEPAAVYSNMLYLHAFAHDLPQDEELELARGWEAAILPTEERELARQAAGRSGGVFRACSLEDRKLRLGIVSAELGSHAVAEFLQPLLQSLDRERFHVTLFPTARRSDARAEHLLSLADASFPLCDVSDAAATALIRREQIDVLMDTSGHTAGNRLGVFARRAAPVQCTYIGYWGTTGLTEMDWFVSDPDAPVASEAGFSEGLWRLPRIAVCYRGDDSLACDQWEPDASGTVWMGSFNKYAKVREETLELWAGVLHAVPEAKLLLEDRGTHDGDSQERILGRLAARGIATERVEFIPYVAGHERHMLLYNRLDIALDTVPFNSGTTAFDALWMGVPLVALDGDWIGGRMSASVLRTLGWPEWIAGNQDEYVRIVRGLAKDVELRTRLRREQRGIMAAGELTDAPSLAVSLGEAFVGMYERWRTQ